MNGWDDCDVRFCERDVWPSCITQQETLFIISSSDERTADSDMMKKSRLSSEDAVCSIYRMGLRKGFI